MKRILAMLLSLIMVVGVFAGCSSSTSDSTDTEDESSEEEDEDEESEESEDSEEESTDDEDEDVEKVFRYSISTEPTTLDPTKGNSIGDNELQHALTESLVRNVAGEIQPGIAESWEVSDDGLTYTFYLREAYWSDGVQITADDFVYSWRRLMDPETASGYAFIGDYIKNGYAVETGEMEPEELGVYAEDDLTLVVELENPTSYWLSLVGSAAQYAPLREDIVEEYGDEFAATADKNVYSGPFKLVSSEDGQWIFEQNEYYWDLDSINWTRVEISLVDNTDTALAMYEAGELDYVSVPMAYVESYADVAETYANGNTDYLLINFETDNEVLLNKNFRLALNYAMDRNEYNTLANSDVYQAYNGLVFYGLTALSDGTTYGELYDLDSYSYPLDGDVELAQEYLAAAMEELGISDPSEITISLTGDDSDTKKKQLEVIQEILQTNLGINVEIVMVTYSELYATTIPNRDYDLVFTGWGADYDDAYSYVELFYGPSSYNSSSYQNDELDALLEASQTETDEQARQDLLNQAEQIILEDAAFIPLQTRNAWYLLDDDISGISFYFCSINIDWVYGDTTETE